jgi:hypothetical protein
MSDRDDHTDLHGDRIATTEARLEGFYWGSSSARTGGRPSGRTRRRSPTGNAANGGSPAKLARGSRRR